jgi:hypothetical protein
MKVIGSGFGRTGTLSLKAALEELGFGPCYHMKEVLLNRKHTEVWYNIAKGEPVDWENLFQDFEATVDFPTSIFYKKLMEVFPSAKVVHTIRDPDSWYDSTKETIYQSTGNYFVPDWLKQWVKRIDQGIGMVNILIWQGLFEGAFDNRQRAIEIFKRYTDEVKQTVPADKLLIFDVKEGWEPLCQFLDVPIPNTPFPHVNDRQSVLKLYQIIWIGIRVVPFILGVALLIFLVIIIKYL